MYLLDPAKTPVVYLLCLFFQAETGFSNCFKSGLQKLCSDKFLAIFVNKQKTHRMLFFLNDFFRQTSCMSEVTQRGFLHILMLKGPLRFFT
ncbi:hypothetical protein SD53_11480 [Rheinheimera mesophila]|nr:hypothetical protein SD53_11480 [Rheinheimera mesophila]